MRKFMILGELIKLDVENRILQVGDRKPIPFDLLDEYVKEFKNVNRIHKPVALLLYTDYKNGKINNYKDCEVK